MLSDPDKTRFLQIALTCLRQPGEDRPIFSPDVPTDDELAQIKQGLKTGNIDEDVLQRFFPMAYEGVTTNGFINYFFGPHNKKIQELARYKNTGLTSWCTAYPAKVLGRIEKLWEVQLPSGKKIITDDEVYPGIHSLDAAINAGDLVIVHRGKICLKMDGKEYTLALNLFNRSTNQQSRSGTSPRAGLRRPASAK